MRKLLLALILVSTASYSATFATMPNQANGKIVLTDEVCKLGNEVFDNLMRAYNYGSAGYTSEGCWIMEDETVVVVWVGGKEKMRYPAANFTLSPKYKQNKKQYNY